jgi:putative DNA primase/helicase
MTHAGIADAMRRFGLVPTAPVEPQPGKFANFAIEGDPPRSQSGWALLADDGRILKFGSRRTGVKGSLQLPGTARGKMAPGDRTVIAQRIADQRKAEEAVAAQVRAMWDKCPKADDWHPALRRLGHGLFADGVRATGNSILVPMIDAEFRLWNVLQIYAVENAPQRHPFKGGRRAGLFWAHQIVRRDGRPTAKPLVIADRYEAASSIHAPTGLPVVASMSPENLEEVARIMRRMFPRREIIVAAHDDRHIEAIPRLTAAVRAAHAIGAKVATPLPLDWRAQEGLGFEHLQFGDIIERIDAAEQIRGAR